MIEYREAVFALYQDWAEGVTAVSCGGIRGALRGGSWCKKKTKAQVQQTWNLTPPSPTTLFPKSQSLATPQPASSLSRNHVRSERRARLGQAGCWRGLPVQSAVPLLNGAGPGGPQAGRAPRGCY